MVRVPPSRLLDPEHIMRYSQELFAIADPSRGPERCNGEKLGRRDRVY